MGGAERKAVHGKPTFRTPVPEGVVEHIGIAAGSANAMVEATDGSLLMISGKERRTSTDGGLTWGDATPLNCQALGSPGALSCIRLASGKLALAHRGNEENGKGTEAWNWNPFYLSTSGDDGQTWTGARPMNLLGGPYHDVMNQTSDGRLVMPSRICHSNNHHFGLEYDRVSSYGWWEGLRLQVSGHYHYPEIDIAAVCYSDDEGTTWERCGGQLMGWFDEEGFPNGRGGITAVDEPSVAECADGRLLLMGRSTVGRLVQTYSEDGGQTWTPVLPNELASSYSPPRLRAIPSTGDLLCVWNQTSRAEILRGYRRGRLSSAISRDSGASWEHFRTLELSDGMDEADRVGAEYPISPVVAMPELGRMPRGFATFDYANVWFAGDRAILTYHRSWVEAGDGEEAVTLGERHGTARRPGEMVLRVYPLDWFYGG